MEGQFRDDLNRFPQNEPQKETKQTKKEKEKLSVEQLKAAEGLSKLTKKQQQERAAEAEGAERAHLLRKIEQYHRYFGDRLPPPPRKLSLKMSSAELQAIVASIESELGMSGGIEIVKEAFGQTGVVLEAVTARFNPLGLQLHGPISLAATFQANRDKWEDLATELAIKYERRFCMSVEARCIQFIGMMVVTVHRANKAAGQVQQPGVKAEKGPSAELYAESEEVFTAPEDAQ